MKTARSSWIARHRMKCLLGVMMALIIADGLVTEFLVSNRLGREGNPFLEPLVGQSTFLIIKAAGALLAAFILWDIHRRQPNLAFVASICFVVVYGGIVCWNLAVVFLAQSNL